MLVQDNSVLNDHKRNLLAKEFGSVDVRAGKQASHFGTVKN